MGRWLFTSRALRYSINDLQCDQVTPWENVRETESCRYIRNELLPGDTILFYNIDPVGTGIGGLALVCSDPYPEVLSPGGEPPPSDFLCDGRRHYLIDIKFLHRFRRPIMPAECALHSHLHPFLSRLPRHDLLIRPVAEDEWRDLLALRTEENIPTMMEGVTR